MCSVRADRRSGLMPSASATSDEMWLWNAVRSGMTEPTTSPWRSAGARAGTESKQALPASQTRSRNVALRTPNFDTPAPTSATCLIGVSCSGRPQGRRPVEVAADDEAQDLRGAAAPEEEARVPEVALDRVL